MLADDHVLMREGIKKLLEFDGSVKVIAEASDGEECLRKLNDFKPQVLLLDIDMPRLNGIEVLEKIKSQVIDVKVLVLTVHNEAEYLLKAFDIGVDGYILKETNSLELKKAIECVVNGDTYIQSELKSMLNNRLSTRYKGKDKIELLTLREIEVLIQVANGMINKEIATLLNISERTVKNHLSNIFKKIDVSDRTQAAVFAIRNDLIKLF